MKRRMIRTIATHLEVDDISDAHVDHTEKALILLLEFLLVENLDGQDAIFVDSPSRGTRQHPWTQTPIAPATYRSKISFQYGFKVFLMTDVVLVCSPPTVATAKGSGKPTDPSG